jgi:hypothetical protein
MLTILFIFNNFPRRCLLVAKPFLNFLLAVLGLDGICETPIADGVTPPVDLNFLASDVPSKSFWCLTEFFFSFTYCYFSRTSIHILCQQQTECSVNLTFNEVDFFLNQFS